VNVAGGAEKVRTFEEFYRSSFDSVARLATVLSGDPATADDLAQETFLRVQPHFHDLETPLAYARTVMVNLCRERRRKESGWQEALHRLPEPAHVVDEASELLDVLDKLPYRQRVVIVLRYYADLTEVEIADALGCRPGTVKSLASRALTRLRKDLSE
jgi:RNA polymerase sigma-70 factor (sigma-E family)